MSAIGRSIRTSDAARDRAAACLARGYAAGLLSTDTFERRIDATLAAKTIDDLAAVVDDLPAAGRRSRILGYVGSLVRRKRAAAEPDVHVALPRRAGSVVVIGRGRACDVVVRDPTVSRCHAVLRAVDGGWSVRDLGSLNHTFVNGARVDCGLVLPGDAITLGGVNLRLM